MDERRKNGRFALPAEVSGKFILEAEYGGKEKQIRKFVIRDIGYGGINILSNFLPDIGSRYCIKIDKTNLYVSFKIEVVHYNILKFSTNDEGLLEPGIRYSIGCKFVSLEEKQREYIKFLIQNRKISVPRDH